MIKFNVFQLFPVSGIALQYNMCKHESYLHGRLALYAFPFDRPTGAIDHNDYVDTVRSAYRVRLLSGWTSSENGRQDSDSGRLVVVSSAISRLDITDNRD